MAKENKDKKSDSGVIENIEKIQCGIVMLIAQMTYIHQEYTEDHWSEVYRIICEACEDYAPRLVSESKTSGMILTDIVQNLYKDDIVICDISGRNPNVFFELGMRLTFDKPTVVLKDDETKIPFDIQGVRMIIYPIGLNYHKVNKLKKEIKDAISDTFENLKKGKPNTFLKHFKDFNIQASKLESENITQNEARILKMENQLDSIMGYILLEKKRSIHPSNSISFFDWNAAPDAYINEFVSHLTLLEKEHILNGYDSYKDLKVLRDKLVNYVFDRLNVKNILPISEDSLLRILGKINV